MLSLSLDPAAGAVAALWIGAALTALTVIVCVRLFGPAGLPGLPGPATLIARYAVVGLALLVAWTFIDRQAARDRAEERRALEARATALTAQAIAPGSPLSCLDAGGGDAVGTACENALFASPETVAAGLSYVVARLTLLSDGIAWADGGDSGYDTVLKDLRRAAEADRFGFVSYVLATRDNCTPDDCAAFSLLDDPSRVRANLREAIFDKHVSNHLANWQNAAVARRAPLDKPAVTTGGTSNWDYPSAASIPPISIMTNEPTGPVTPPPVATVSPPPASTGSADANPPTPPRRPATAPVRRAQNPGPPTSLAPVPPAATAGTPAPVQ